MFTRFPHPARFRAHLAAFAALTAAFALSTGCAPRPFADLADPRWSPDSLAGRPAAEPGHEPGAAPAAMAEAPTGELTLRDALAAALLRSPRLRATAWEPRIAEARKLQAGLRPNPELEAGLEGFAGDGELSGVEGAETTVLLSQLVELGGKRQRRIEAAEAGRAVALAAYEEVRLEVLTDTTLRYLGVLALQRRVELAERAAGLAEEASSTVQRRVDAGDASPIDATRSGLERDSAAIRVDRLQRRLDTARRELAAAWDQDHADLRPPRRRAAGRARGTGAGPAARDARRPPLAAAGRRGGGPEPRRTRTWSGAGRCRTCGWGSAPSTRPRSRSRVWSPACRCRCRCSTATRATSWPTRLEAARAEDAIGAARRDLALRLTRAHGDLAVAHREAQSVEALLLPAATEAYEATRRAYQEGQRSPTSPCSRPSRRSSRWSPGSSRRWRTSTAPSPRWRG